MSGCPRASEHGFDPMDLIHLEDPFAVYADLRRDDPVHWSPAHGGFHFVTRHEDVKEVARRHEVFISSAGATIPAAGNPMPLIPLEIDPPDHTEIRQSMARWFAASEARKLEAELRGLVTELLDSIVPRGRAEFVAEFTSRIPPMVIALVLGLPREHWNHFQDLGNRFIEAVEAGDLEENQRVALELAGYIGSQLESRRADPRDDMLTAIGDFRLQGDPLSQEQAVGLAFFLLQAGHETTAVALASMFAVLAQDHDAQKRLIAEPALLQPTIEECLRYQPPVHFLARTAAADVTVGGTSISKGEKVLVGWGSACRDSREFEDADTFVMDRPRNNHLAFGSGIHRCLGANLARLQLRVALQEVLSRMPYFRIDEDDRVVMGGVFSRGPKHLPLRW